MIGIIFGHIGRMAVRTGAAVFKRFQLDSGTQAEQARTLRTEQTFMPGDAETVDVHGLKIDGDEARGLGGIDHKEKPMFVGEVAESRQIIEIAAEV